LACQFERIESTIRYALSQRNNHGISEIVGLWTGSIILPDHPRASIWRKKALHHLIILVEDQFATDGGYIQHSVNYHRFALDLLCWAKEIGERNGLTLPDGVVKAMRKGRNLLYQLQDTETGWLPNYGSNDGALLIPLTDSPYEDYRPSLQAAGYSLDSVRTFEAGRHDEQLIWFHGFDALEGGQVAAVQTSLRARSSGYFTLRGKESFGFIRAASYRNRPGQADNLHFDLWRRGENLIFDPGTFSYNDPAPWNNGLAMDQVHNTAGLEEYPQMVRGPRFLWFDWVRSKLVAEAGSGPVEYLEVEQTAYPGVHPPIRQRRAILRIEDSYLVVDRLVTGIERKYRVHWNLLKPPDSADLDKGILRYSPDGDDPFTIICRATGNIDLSLVSAREDSVEGWLSRRYHERQPCSHLRITARESEWTCLTGFGFERVDLDSNGLVTVEGPDVEMTARLGDAKNDDALLSNVVCYLLPDRTSLSLDADPGNK